MMLLERSVLRRHCRAHAQRRCAERGIPLEPDQLRHLEHTLERMRPCFEEEGRRRYQLTVRCASGRLQAVYDTRLQCVIAAWPCGWLSP